jgi:hypothetical protein
MLLAICRQCRQIHSARMEKESAWMNLERREDNERAGLNYSGYVCSHSRD